MEISTIVKTTMLAHESIENLKSIVGQAVKDRRFKMTLADHRAFRDLIDDMQLMLEKDIWMESMQIPVELPVKGESQEVNDGLASMMKSDE